MQNLFQHVICIKNYWDSLQPCFSPKFINATWILYSLHLSENISISQVLYVWQWLVLEGTDPEGMLCIPTPTPRHASARSTSQPCRASLYTQAEHAERGTGIEHPLLDDSWVLYFRGLRGRQGYENTTDKEDSAGRGCFIWFLHTQGDCWEDVHQFWEAG